ncbi:MAG: iron-containing alcohol dehydrogenase [Candidatus Latescibacteria bacterium]|nr:iron-containing alcohol dehydrogenase [Candidatus Latescibacterota bacterium]
MEFNFHNPTDVYFGPGEFTRAGELASRLGRKCLLVTGRGSARRLGFLEKMEKMLDEAGVGYVHYSGIEPNPHLETCADAAEVAVEEECDFIVALGGGSVMDACKAIAVGFHDPDNLWDYINHGQGEVKRVEQALPLMVIPTLAATGSEMDNGGVITRWETREKCVISSPKLFPGVALIDPELTVSVPLDYTMDGVFDMAVHVMESYFNGDRDTPLQGRIIEGFLLAVFDEGAKLYRDPSNLKLRENVQWPSSLALSGFFTAGRGGVYPVHLLEHPLSGHWDISHGRGLALIQPRWMWYVLDSDPVPFARFAANVMGIDPSGDYLEDARAGVKALCKWLDGVDLFLTLSDLGIDEGDGLVRAAEDSIRLYGGKNGQIGGVMPLGLEDVLAIYRMCGTRDFI